MSLSSTVPPPPGPSAAGTAADGRAAGSVPAGPASVRRRPSRGGVHRPAASPFRWGLGALLLATAVLYLWGLGASGYANEFYAAAVQAGTQSWKAMFFGSLDGGNAITVDKPAFFLWPMVISARIFGLNGWSLLVPQALEGVAAVAVLTATVRRVAGDVAGLAAGALLAVTPVAVLMFRFDNPDAMLTLLLSLAAYAAVRAITVPGAERGARRRATRWIAVAGAIVGLAFITKMGQAFLVVPGIALAYLIAAPAGLGRRIVDLLAAGVALVVGAGWWVAAVQLTPAADRPYVGGSTNDSILQLAFGYNGLGRLFGGSGNGGGGGGGGGGSGNSGFGGATGIDRLFVSSSGMATEISWLLPTALIALCLGLWLSRRAPRTDPSRAALVLFGGWLLVTGVVFSYMQGTIHPYYTIALAPAITGLIAVTGRLLWLARSRWSARLFAAVLVEVTVLWDAHLLGLTPTFVPWLRTTIVVVGSACALVLVAGGLLGRLLGQGSVRRVTAVGLLAGLLAGVGGSMAYAVSTASQTHSGSIPTAGPSGGMGGMGSGMGGGGMGRPGGTGSASTGRAGSAPGGMGGAAAPDGTGQAPGAASGSAPSGSSTSGSSTSGSGAPAGMGGFPGGSSSAGSSSGSASSGSASAGSASAEGSGQSTGSRMGGGPGGGGQGTSAALVALLKATHTRWAAATIGSQSSAPLQLASGKAVMAIGGFTGSDNAPTLAEFEAWVAAGKVHYFIGGSGNGTPGGGGGPGGGTDAASAISSWVAAHYTATTVGGETVYDLTARAS